MDEEARQAVRGGYVLAALETELLGDDLDLRHQLLRLRDVLEEWVVAGDQAVLTGTDSRYTEQDRTDALTDHRNACAQALNLIRIAEENE